jgi:hypothetical protein
MSRGHGSTPGHQSGGQVAAPADAIARTRSSKLQPVDGVGVSWQSTKPDPVWGATFGVWLDCYFKKPTEGVGACGLWTMRQFCLGDHALKVRLTSSRARGAGGRHHRPHAPTPSAWSAAGIKIDGNFTTVDAVGNRRAPRGILCRYFQATRRPERTSSRGRSLELDLDERAVRAQRRGCLPTPARVWLRANSGLAPLGVCRQIRRHRAHC